MEQKSDEQRRYEWERGRYRFHLFAVWYMTTCWAGGVVYFIYLFASERFEYWWVGLILLWFGWKVYRGGHKRLLPETKTGMLEAKKAMDNRA